MRSSWIKQLSMENGTLIFVTMIIQLLSLHASCYFSVKKLLELKNVKIHLVSYDGAEICELVCLYFLDKLSKILDKADGGLYKDDGLAAVNNSNGPLMDKLRQKIIALFKEENCSITIDTNLDETDFLDVPFNLKTGKYFPFR